MRSFEYYTPTKVIFGKDTHLKIGELLKDYNCHKVLIHYGSESAVKSGLIHEISKCLTEAGIDFVTLGGVVPNPRLSKVREGISLCQKESVDFILAVGGGSVIDSAKAIGYGVANPWTDVWNFFLKTEIPNACLPIGAIPTIAASGSEMSGSCVITNEDGWLKRGSTRSDLCRPKFTLMNPRLTYTLPEYQTESGCVDILLHTMERYFTNGGNMEITDALAEGLLRTVMENAKILHTEPDNYDARAEIMWAGSLAHNDLTGCGNDGGDFMSHKLEHELGGMFDVTHGAGLAAIWPSWARYVYKYCLSRFVKYAKNVMGVTAGGSDEETALLGIKAMEEFYHSIGMPVNLKELGIHPTEEQIREMAEGCLKASGSSTGSAKKLDLQDMIRIYQMANEA